MFGGAPSPNKDFPQTVRVVKGENSVKIQNKNWFDPAKLSQVANYNTYDNITGLWTTNDGAIANRSFFYSRGSITTTRDITKLIKLKQNTIYTAKVYDFINNSSSDANVMGFSFWNSQGINISISYTNDGFIVINTPNEECYLDISRRASSGTFSFSKIMIVEGEYTEQTFPEFVEHQEQNYTITLPTGMELCKIGDYEDKIFHNIPSSPYYDSSLVEGGWYKHNEVAKYTSCISVSAGETIYRFKLKPRSSLHDMTSDTSKNTPALINNMIVGTTTATALVKYDYGWDGLAIYTRKSYIGDLGDATQAKEWFDNNVVAYVGIDPEYDYQTNDLITDTTLIEALNSVYMEPMSYDGETNVVIASDGNNAQMLATVSTLNTNSDFSDNWMIMRKGDIQYMLEDKY